MYYHSKRLKHRFEIAIRVICTLSFRRGWLISQFRDRVRTRDYPRSSRRRYSILETMMNGVCWTVHCRPSPSPNPIPNPWWPVAKWAKTDYLTLLDAIMTRILANDGMAYICKGGCEYDDWGCPKRNGKKEIHTIKRNESIREKNVNQGERTLGEDKHDRLDWLPHLCILTLDLWTFFLMKCCRVDEASNYHHQTTGSGGKVNRQKTPCFLQGE